MNNLTAISKLLLQCGANSLSQQIRTTFILRRKYPAPLAKKGQSPKHLKRKHYIYEMVEDTSNRPLEPLSVILLKDVENVGLAGQRISVKPNKAYKTLLLPGLAVYASPENIKKYERIEEDNSTENKKTLSAAKTINILSTLNLSVIMSLNNPWTLEKWHIRASFRKASVWVPDEAITMPDKVITGPDLAKENKEFYVTVNINNKMETKVRCRIHHWSANPNKRLPYVPNFWELPSEPIFIEDKPILDALPLHKSLQKKMT